MDTHDIKEISQFAKGLFTQARITDELLESSMFHGFGQKIPIFYVPASNNDSYFERQTRKFMIALTMCGRCDDKNSRKWQTLVLTFAVLALPPLRTIIAGQKYADFELREFPNEFEQSIDNAIELQMDTETMGNTFISFPPDLPDASDIPFNAQHIHHGKMEALIAYFAMMVFIFGKSAGQENITSIQVRRPAALIKRCHIEEGVFYLTGEGAIKSSNYAMIRAGWSKSGPPRIDIFPVLAQLSYKSDISQIYIPLQINMRMLRNANQTFLPWIANLLYSCPYVTKMPTVGAEFEHFVRMIEFQKSLPVHIQEYYKLIYQDQDNTITRRNVSVMISCATVLASQTVKSMVRYRISEGTQNAVQDFIKLAAEHGHVFKLHSDQQTIEGAAA